MKKIISSVLALTLLTSATAFAYEFPSSFWPVNTGYENAYSSGNDEQIVSYGKQAVELLLKEPENEATMENILNKSYGVGRSAYRLGDFTTALKHFEIASEYAKKKNQWEMEKISNDYILQLTPRLETYQHTDKSQWTYGVKNEPSGVIYGQISEKSEPNESMILLYLEYGDTYFDWANVVLKKAQSENKSVELALNFPHQGSTASSIHAGDSYLNSLYSLLQNYTSVPIYLRIGSEFNIWGNACSPETYIAAYKTIANHLRSLNNISFVWSISHTSTWNVDENAFYPGDEYVDWVGMAVYGNKYFQAKPYWDRNGDFNEVCFKTGRNSDPVLMMEKFIRTYGDRKPVMISECGGAYRTTGEVNQNHIDYATSYIKQMYTYLPMVYPQVKAILYFNKLMTNETNYYDLENCSQSKETYNQIVKSPWFVQDKSTNKAQVYFKHLNDTIEAQGDVTLSVYPHLYNEENITVEYYVNGNLYKSVSEMPYTATLSGLYGGSTVKVVAKGANGASMTKEYSVNGGGVADTTGFYDTAALSEVQKSAITYAVDKGIVKGYSDNTFKPDNTITRAEFATMVCRLKGFEETGKCAFKDAQNHWASSFIKACSDRGMINGVGDNNFAPDNKVTLEQALKILTILYGVADENTPYPDGFIAAAKDNGLLSDLTNLTSDAPLKRVDAAMLMYNGR